MPTYEYECTECKHVFEVEQRITEPPLTFCPQKTCKGFACQGFVRRLIQRTSFSLKGGGWFKTGGY